MYKYSTCGVDDVVRYKRLTPHIRFIAGVDGSAPEGEPSVDPVNGDSVEDVETSGEVGSASAWELAFPGKTPDEIKEKVAEVDKWKEFSRKWEARSKESKKTVDQAEKKLGVLENEVGELRPKVELFAGAQRELDLVYELINQGADIRAALDSRSFMADVSSLDKSDDEYAEKVKAAVERLNQRLPQRGWVSPSLFEKGAGDAVVQRPSLYELVNGSSAVGK